MATRGGTGDAAAASERVGIVGLGALIFALARSRVSPEELGGILMSPLRMANDRMGDYVQV